MQINKINYMMIKIAIEKGIRDIKENPKRGIRNLVDLGQMFSNGEFQKSFFELAQKELTNENSNYYKLVKNIFNTTENGLLMNFGMNLIYNSWVQGASFIREREAAYGFNIPWTIFIEPKQNQYLAAAEIEKIINQGKELGIYCYIFKLDPHIPDLASFFRLLDKEKECAFFLLIDPVMVTDYFIDYILKIKTCLVAINIDDEDDAQIKKSAQALTQSKCFSAGYTMTLSDPEDISQSLAKSLALELPFVIIMDDKEKYYSAKHNYVIDKVHSYRKELSMPVFPIHMWNDIALIDRNISNEACLMSLEGDGSVSIFNVEKGLTMDNLNIHNSTLKEIFSKLLIKNILPA